MKVELIQFKINARFLVQGYDTKFTKVFIMKNVGKYLTFKDNFLTVPRRNFSVISEYQNRKINGSKHLSPCSLKTKKLITLKP